MNPECSPSRNPSCFSWLLERFQANPDAVAFYTVDERQTYQQLLDRIGFLRKTRLEKNNIQPGEVVAVLSDFSMDAIALFLALVINQNVIVPIAPGHENETARKLEEAQVDWMFTVADSQLQMERRPCSNRKHAFVEQLKSGGHAGLILFSSGSTGHPKGMVHDLDVMLASYQGRPVKPLNILMLLLFDHIGGLDSMFRALSIGATLSLPKSREPLDVAEIIEKRKVEVLPASPSFLNLLLLSGAHRQYDLSSLRIIGYGAERMPDQLLDRLKQAFPKVVFQQKFGTSETNAIKVLNHAQDCRYMKIDDPNVTCKIVDGELWLKSQTRILGYLDPGHNGRITADQWFKTGDLVEELEDGYFRIIGRVQEMINVGGQKVLPEEVEHHLRQIPGVLDCLVYGEENPILGQMVVADIVFERPVSGQELRKIVHQHLKGLMEHYKIPGKIRRVESIAVNHRFKRVKQTHG